MREILNTLCFEPSTTTNFKEKFNLIQAPTIGVIFIHDGEVIKGEKIIETIKAQPDDTFLVPKTVFDYLNELGYRNIAIFDPKLSEGDDLCNMSQGGLIFAK